MLPLAPWNELDFCKLKWSEYSLPVHFEIWVMCVKWYRILDTEAGWPGYWKKTPKYNLCLSLGFVLITYCFRHTANIMGWRNRADISLTCLFSMPNAPKWMLKLGARDNWYLLTPLLFVVGPNSRSPFLTLIVVFYLCSQIWRRRK